MDTLITLCPINHQLLLIKGPDAKKFLQGQVTSDVNALDSTLSMLVAAPLGAHCTHKGRVVFSFRALQLPENDAANNEQTIALSVPDDIVDIAVAALKKYSVFSKVDILTMKEDISESAKEQYQLLGVFGDDACEWLQQLTDDKAAIPTELNTAIHTSRGSIVCIAKNSYELWLTKEQALDITGEAIGIPQIDGSFWHERVIKSGIANIHKDTSTQFTPHQLNYQQIGNAISFSKGCYTGQEVVARMHYLGKLKRQLCLFEVTTIADDTQVSPNSSLYITGKDQAIGTIIDVSKHNNHYFLLASVVVEHVGNKNIFLDLSHQQAIHLLTINA
ncbi:MAG: folate-binding protein YgfZ [Granulosicoccus sp.]|jgi:folate-binding protein YgfZ